MPDLSEIGRLVDRDFVLHRAQLCVVNSEWSKDLLSVTPHRPVEGTDLSVYARIRVGEDASMVPRYEQLEAAGIAPEELLDAAAENSRPSYKIEALDDVIARMIGAEPPEEKCGTYVITNDTAFQGAAAITDPEVLAGAYDLIGSEEIYIIPSSVHECLALPANIPAEEVNAMIQEINRTEVKLEDRLGDHAYLQQLVDEYVNGGKLDEFLNRTRSQIDSLVASDPTAFYTDEEYETAAQMFYKTVKLRADSIRGQLDGTIPSTDEGQRQDSSSLIDASEIDIKAMGQFDMGLN